VATYWESLIVEIDYNGNRGWVLYSHEQEGTLESVRDVFGKALRENDSSSRRICYEPNKLDISVLLWFLCESRWEPCAAYGQAFQPGGLLYKRQTEVGD
jgi:hypothetical protein